MGEVSASQERLENPTFLKAVQADQYPGANAAAGTYLSLPMPPRRAATMKLEDGRNHPDRSGRGPGPDKDLWVLVVPARSDCRLLRQPRRRRCREYAAARDG